MPGKYEPLTERLLAADAQGQESLELSFEAIADLVGGLPASAEVRQWWANNSQTQALAWRAAGYHVDQVYLDRKRVLFTRGAVGGSYHDRNHRTQQTRPPAATVISEPTGEIVDLRVRLHWHTAGPVALDGRGKVHFGTLETGPGIYRMTLHSGVIGDRPRVYIGETQNMRHRLAGNYRNPGATQKTSTRIGALLVQHLTSDGRVDLAVAPEASITLPDGTEQPLDLSRSASRLLAENAALVLAQLTDHADIVNLE